MNKITLFSMILLTAMGLAHAELTSSSTPINNQPWQAYGQGQGYGANYYNQQYNPSIQYNTPQYTQNANTQTKMAGSSDILWLFTGSDSSLSDQIRNGFHSNSQTTFWNRVWSVFAGAAYRRFVSPLEYRLGAMENQITNVGTNYLNGQSNGTQYCYQCMQQNSTNPYATNQNSMAPIFGGGAPTSGASPAGGIVY